MRPGARCADRDDVISSGIEPPAAPASPASLHGRGPGEELPIDRILVVDDSPTMAKLLEVGLVAAGFDVRVAHDGSSALALALAECPDMVLADVTMPGIDGVELTRRLREDPRTASVPASRRTPQRHTVIMPIKAVNTGRVAGDHPVLVPGLVEWVAAHPHPPALMITNDHRILDRPLITTG